MEEVEIDDASDDASVDASVDASSEDVSSKEICKELWITAKVLYNQTKECDTAYGALRQKIIDKSLTQALIPKTSAVRKWLKTLCGGIQLYEVISYDEFLDAFFTLYEKEGRLDFASRTLSLRAKDAKVFGLIADTPITIYSFLAALPSVFS